MWRVRMRAYGHFLRSMWAVTWRLLYGMWRLTRLPQPAVTIFGGSRIKTDNVYAKEAAELAKKLAADGFSIITGGGPGIMEAANHGAYEYFLNLDAACRVGRCSHDQCTRKLVTLGIGVRELDVDRVNAYLQDYIIMEHFFARKWLLVRYAVGFVFFPGGFGTVDELFEIVTLIQNKQMSVVPVVLVGGEYWRPLKEWMIGTWLKQGLISPADVDIVQIVDDIESAFRIIRSECMECNRHPK